MIVVPERPSTNAPSSASEAIAVPPVFALELPHLAGIELDPWWRRDADLDAGKRSRLHDRPGDIVTIAVQ